MLETRHITFRRLNAAAPAIAAFAAIAASLLLLRGMGSLYYGARISDLVDYFYPQRFFLSRVLRNGIFPLWDPHNYCGVPVVEIQQSAMFHPFALLSLLAPARLGLLLFTASVVCFAAWATYVALRRVMGYSAIASAVGTVTYVLGGMFASRVIAGHLTVITGLSTIPLAMALTWTAARRRRGAFGLIALAGLCNAMVIVSGAPQYVMYLFYMQLLAAVLATGRRHWKRGIVTFGAIWGMGALLGAPQWLPALSYIPYSARARGGASEATALSDIVLVIFETLLPFPLGDDIRQPHIQSHNVWETYSYPGTAAVVLSLLAITGVAIGFLLRRAGRRITRRELLPIVLVLLSLYFMLNGPAPGTGSFRGPMKARAILVVALVFATAGQFDLLVRRSLRSRLPALAAGIAALLCLGALIAAMWAMNNRELAGQLLLRFARRPPVDSTALEFFSRAKQNPALASARFVPAAACVAALSGVLTLAFLFIRRKPFAAVTTIAIIAVAEPALHHWHAFQSRHPFDAIELPGEIRDYLDQQRFASPAAGSLSWRISLPSEFPTRAHLGKYYDVAGYEPLMPQGAGSRHSIGVPGDSITTAVRDHITALALGKRIDLSQWRRGERAESVARETTAAIASIERRIEQMEGPIVKYGPSPDGVHYLTNSGWARGRKSNAGDEDHRISEALEMISPEKAATTATEFLAEAKSLDPAVIQYRMRLNSPALLVARSTWLPGWRARVDNGNWQRPLCANFWMLAVPVEAGEHTIVLRYRPVHLPASFVMCAIGFIALGGAGLLHFRRGTSRLHSRNR